MMAEQMRVKLLQHVRYEIHHFGQYVKLLSTNGTFSPMKKPGWRFEYSQIRFRHFDMMPSILIGS